ncbi:MAG: hypothetical protein ACE5JS_04420 [Nitrospinota bacterium]
MTGLSRVLTAVCVGLVLIGCRAIRQESKEDPSAPQYRFEDVPVHPGLKMDQKKTFIFETQSLKAGILVYYGNESIAEVVDFFKVEMPKHAWRLINAIEARGTASLNFDKEGWQALVRVRRTALTTELEITIGPKDPAGPIRPSPPKRK